MRYSVFDYGRQVYDYYETPDAGGTHAPAAPIRGRTQLGATVDQAAWKLPLSARKIGSGNMPIGRIATLGGGGILGDVPDNTMKLGLVAGLAYLAWRHLR